MRAIIDDTAGLFTLINTFHVRPDDATAVVRSLRTFTEETARHLPGFVGTSIHKSLDNTRVVNYVQWQSAEHLAAMLALPAAKLHMEDVRLLSELVDPVPYSVAYVSHDA